MRSFIVGALAALALLLSGVSSEAQWQVPSHAMPIGAGAGNVGFRTVGPATAGYELFSTGLTTDPIFAPGINGVTAFGASGIGTTTTGTIISGANTLALVATDSFANGQGILVSNAGAAFSGSITAPSGVSVTPGNSSGGATSYCYALASVDNAGGVGIATTPVCTSAAVATLGNHTAASLRAYNAVAWTLGTGASYTAIWRNTGGGAYCLLGEFVGTLIDDLVMPCQTGLFWLPTVPTVATQSDWLQTTVTAGGGTTGLTLAANAGSTATAVVVRHDDTAAINAAANAGPGIFFPCGTFDITSFTSPAALSSISGIGQGCVNIIGINGILTGLATGLADPGITWTTMQLNKTFQSLANVSISTLAPMSIMAVNLNGAIGGAGGTGQVVHDVNLSGTVGVNCYHDSSALLGPNIVVANWWHYGIKTFLCDYSVIHNNEIQVMGGEAGGFYMSPAGLGLIGIGIGNYVSQHVDIIANKVTPFGGVFGISTQSNYSELIDNHVECSTHEAVNTSASASYSKISGNYGMWTGGASVNGSTPAQCTSDDFGMSFTTQAANGFYDEISNNYIYGSWAVGLEVATNNGAFSFDHVSVFGNTLANDGVVAGAVLELDGQVTNSVVGPNTFILPTVANYDVREQTFAGGTPANNVYAVQYGAKAATGYVNIIAATSHFQVAPALTAGPASY